MRLFIFLFLLNLIHNDEVIVTGKTYERKILFNDDFKSVNHNWFKLIALNKRKSEQDVTDIEIKDGKLTPIPYENHDDIRIPFQFDIANYSNYEISVKFDLKSIKNPSWGYR